MARVGGITECEIQPVCDSSDTEPETDDDIEGSTPQFDLCFPRVVQQVSNICEKVARAIDFLEGCEIATSHKDTETETVVLAQAGLLIEFLQSFSSLHQDEWHSEQVLSRYKRIGSVHISFVNRLFEMRKLHRLTRRLSPFTTAVNVSWVDVVLVHLGLISVALASGDTPEEWNTTTADSLTRRQRDNCVFAAVQLPESSSSLHAVIASRNSSPAAKRLALRLLFSVYVLGGRLNNYDPCICNNIDPEEFANTCLEALHLTYQGGGDVQIAQDAIHCSMLVSLIMNVHRSTKIKMQGDLIRPHSLGLLLEVIRIVTTYDLQEPVAHLTSPREDLNPGVTVLVGCGNILPWCWLLWDDHRIAGFECILYLTVTWLYHWDNGSLPRADPSQHLQLFIQEYPKSSLRVLLQILIHAMDYLNQHTVRELANNPFMVVLSRSCWAVCEVMESDNDIQCYLTGLCSYLLKVFLHLHATPDPEALVVKELILEPLTHVDDQTFRVQLKAILSVMPSLMQQMTEAAISTAKSLLRKTRDESFENQVNFVRIALNFLVISWHKKYELCILRGTASTLLNLTADLASMTRSIGSITSSEELLSDLMTGLATISSRPDLAIDISPERRDALWELVVNNPWRKFPIFGSFASYLATATVLPNALQCAEAWDYLSSVLLSIVQRKFTEEEDPAILTSPSICLALIKLLGISVSASRFIMSSPWTISLVNQLHKVLECKEDCDNTYTLTLSHRLGRIGTRLCDELNHRIRGRATNETEGTAYDTEGLKTKLLYGHWEAHSCLLLVLCTSET